MRAETSAGYMAVKNGYLCAGDLLTLALFDYCLQYTPGAFWKIKRTVNRYALGQISALELHAMVKDICDTAVVGGFILPMQVFDAEFHLLLGGIAQDKEEAALAVHQEWLSQPPVAAPVEAPVAQAQASEPPVAQVEPPVAQAPVAQAQAKPRPPYNNYNWPSPLARRVAFEMHLTTNRRCKHVDALELIRWKFDIPTVDQLLSCSRMEFADKFFPYKHNGKNTFRTILVGRGR